MKLLRAEFQNFRLLRDFSLEFSKRSRPKLDGCSRSERVGEDDDLARPSVGTLW